MTRSRALPHLATQVVSAVLLAAACGNGDAAPSSHADGGAGTAGSGSDAAPDTTTDASTLQRVCVKSPVPAAWPGDAACPVLRPGVADALDEALAKAGIDRCAYGFSAATMSIWAGLIGADPRKLPYYEPLHLALLRMPAFGRETEGWLDAALDGAQPLSTAILAAAARRGNDVDGCLDLAPYAAAWSSAAPLPEAVAVLIERSGASADRAALAAQLADVPLDLQRALVPVVGAVEHAAAEHRASLGTTDSAALDWLGSVAGFVLGSVPLVVDAEHLKLVDAVDEPRMVLAAALLARAVEDADLARFAGVALPSVAIDTPIGAIVLGGPAADTYDPGSAAERAALLVDSGGADTYRVPVAAGRREVPASVAIDLGGADHYGYVELPDSLDAPTRLPSDEAGRSGALYNYGVTASHIGRQGSGVLGIGLSYDLGADRDVYHSLALSQGAAAVGVGALYDEGGDDEYAAETMSQGAALWGIGVLVDRAGVDEHRVFAMSQGFGYVRGVGVAVDGDGNDVWFADPGDPAVGGDPLYASAQLPGEGNSSFTQGAGFGRRDDANGFNMAGGLGVLYDRRGDDHYTTSVFGQAAGYWMGMGMLLEGAGTDTYDGLWYVQGATAHFALALFLEHSGDDQYNVGFPVRATSIGVGHDFSGTLHVDEGGDDVYEAPGLSLGTGYAEGVGGLVNVGGNDRYSSSGSLTLGGASIAHGPPFDNTRDAQPVIGLFVDTDGSDTYTVPGGVPAASDGATWSYAEHALDPGAPATEKSGGVDRNGGAATIP